MISIRQQYYSLTIQPFFIVDRINNNCDLPIIEQSVNSEQKKFVYPKYSDLTTDIENTIQS
jgi:hypothetical protein